MRSVGGSYMASLMGPGVGVRGPAGRPPGVPEPSHPEEAMQRPHELAAFYAREAGPLQRAVPAIVHTSPATIEDACSHAWGQLVARLDRIELGKGAYWWL